MNYKKLSNFISEKDQLLIKRNQKCGNIHLYDKNVCYIASFTLTKGRLYFNSKCYYDNIQAMLDSINEYVKTLKHPSYYYDPNMRRAYLAEMVIDAYMKSIGFVRGKSKGYEINGAYVFNDIYGNPILELSIVFDVKYDDTDNENGSIYRIIDRFNCVRSTFTNTDECIAQINSLVEAELLTNTVNALNTLEKISSARNYNFEMMKVTGALSVEKYGNYRAKVKEMLETALKNIE